MSDWPSSDFAAPRVQVQPRAGGGFNLRCGHELPAALPLVTERLAHWAQAAPERPAFVECRGGGTGRSISYRELHETSCRIAAGLIQRGLSADKPFITLAGNGIDHAVLRVAALQAGVPFAPLSPTLLQLAGGAQRLADIARLLDARLVCADDAAAVCAVLQPAGLGGIEVQAPETPIAPNARGVTGWPAALQAEPGAQFAERAAAVNLDSIAAVFFTSGSTGTPKGVITTQRMLSANQAAYTVLWPFLALQPPRLLDWLPWHHTFGGNDNFHKMLWHGGTLYIDDGRPTPEGIARSIANLGVVRPSLHINVPRGLELLLDATERDAPARQAFLHDLRVLFFAGAGLSHAIWSRLQALVQGHAAASGRRIALVSGWGATECGSTICLVHFPIDGPQIVGLPLPGYDLALVPKAGKLEARVRGPNVTPGYWAGGTPGRPGRSAFDDQGFYCTGDAARWLDPARPEAGLVFDGRVAEDFKLSTGTWVSVGPLRLALLTALAPLVRELAIAGHGEHCVGALLFLEPAACARALGLAHDTPLEFLAASPALRARVSDALNEHNARQSGSSTLVRRALLLADQPSAAAGEINDKGYLNQRVALDRRAALVRQLFEPGPPAGAEVLSGL